jgi:NAD(P)-dependent dehydrogenase (short-subunit alcohol dehydrogenase family)
MDLDLGGKTVVISGGAKGIGRACAEAFAREGANIAILDWDEEALSDAQAAIAGIGVKVLTQKVDVSSSAEVDAAHARAIDVFGAIDVGFNNAGVGSPFKAIEDTTDADWMRVININLTGIFNCVRAQVRHMKPRNKGVIVNTASNVAFAGAPGATPYVAAKHGIVGITRTVALELAPTNVRINTIAPGAIRTTLGRSKGGTFVDPFPDALIRKGLPIGRWGEVQEVADAVLWLASARSQLALGETLILDGGFSAQ